PADSTLAALLHSGLRGGRQEARARDLTMHKRARLAMGIAVASVPILSPALARAQHAGTGILRGRVTDATNGHALGGVTVVAKGPHSEQAVLTDDTGAYRVRSLVPGRYVLQLYLGQAKLERTGVNVGAGEETRIDVPMQPRAGETDRQL